MRHWAERDLSGVISWAVGRSPRSRLYALGHSFGGQCLGLAPNADRLEALVTVAAQSGYWGHWPRPKRYAYALLWYVGMPILSRLLGYFPSRRLGFGEDLARGVALQWAQWAHWCRSPEYLGDYGGHRSFDAPILALSFSDDPFAPPAAVEALHARYGRRVWSALAMGPLLTFAFTLASTWFVIRVLRPGEGSGFLLGLSAIFLYVLLMIPFYLVLVGLALRARLRT